MCAAWLVLVSLLSLSAGQLCAEGESDGIQLLVARAKAAFDGVHGPGASDGPDVHIAFAPGRVNLIGEHVDYTGGFVLPIALDLGTVALGRASRGELSRILSADVRSTLPVESFRVAPGMKPASGGGWVNYVRGVLDQYRGDIDVTLALQGRGRPGSWGVDIAFASSVPLGAGLSSSASLEVATATLLESIFSIGARKVSPAVKARRCQLAEHTFAGVPCGMMDQLAAVGGQADRALLIDTREVAAALISPAPPGSGTELPGVTLVPMDSEDVRVVVIDSHEKHELGSSEYPKRVAQCADALAALAPFSAGPEPASLRDCTLSMLDRAQASASWVGQATWFRRARHVLGENQRTQKAAEALRRREWAEFGRLMDASHASLRDDYECSTERLDWIASQASAHDGVYGARLTGAGFGGCVVALVRQHAVEALSKHLSLGYEEVFGESLSVFVTRAGAGARVLATPQAPP